MQYVPLQGRKNKKQNTLVLPAISWGISLILKDIRGNGFELDPGE